MVRVDGLVKKLEEMEKTAGTYRNLMEHTRRLLRAFFDLSQAHRGMYVTGPQRYVCYRPTEVCVSQAHRGMYVTGPHRYVCHRPTEVCMSQATTVVVSNPNF